MNQRDIKFRAWDEKRKAMFSVECLTFPLSEEYAFIKTAEDKSKYSYENLAGYGMMSDDEMVCNYKIMQFTGLKDKNGVEIYEGDIIHLFSGGKWVVRFENGSFLVPDNNLIDKGVIGNIYENPELLKPLTTI